MTYTAAQLARIAKAQKLLLWAVLALVSANLATVFAGQVGATGSPLNLALITCALGALAFVIVAIIRMAAAVATPGFWIGAVLAIIVGIIPFVGLLGLLLLNQRAYGILQGAGVKIGFMGANSEEIEKLRAGFPVIPVAKPVTVPPAANDAPPTEEM